MEMSSGERFARAIAAKDGPALHAVLSANVDFRALTPGRFWEADTAAEVVDNVMLGHWFEPSDRIDGIEQIESDVVVDTERVGQTGIEWLRVVCSGFRPIGTAE